MKGNKMDWQAPAYLTAQIALHVGFLIFWIYAKYFLEWNILHRCDIIIK